MSDARRTRRKIAHRSGRLHGAIDPASRLEPRRGRPRALAVDRGDPRIVPRRRAWSKVRSSRSVGRGCRSDRRHARAVRRRSPRPRSARPGRPVSRLGQLGAGGRASRRSETSEVPAERPASRPKRVGLGRAHGQMPARDLGIADGERDVASRAGPARRRRHCGRSTGRPPRASRRRPSRRRRPGRRSPGRSGGPRRRRSPGRS